MQVLLAVDGSEPSLASVARIRSPTLRTTPTVEFRTIAEEASCAARVRAERPASRDERCFRPTEGQANHRDRSERRSVMLPRLVLAAFLLGHAAIHAGYLSPRPAATVGGPPWPFDLTHS